MKIDSQFIKKWAPKYDEIESDQGEYLSLIKCVNEEVSSFQTINVDTFERIIRWKSLRTKGYIRWNNYEIYQKAFQKIIDPKFTQKMNILVSLPGIGPPIASAILHFIFPEIFPMYDFRTAEVLYNLGHIKTKATDLSLYPDFQDAISNLRISLVHYNLREIDRALFAYHKINSKQVEKDSLKNKTKCFNAEHENNKVASRLPIAPFVQNLKAQSIPKTVQSICEKLGINGKIITRKEILERAKQYGLNESAVLPADYCDNTKTGQWSKHSFLHSVSPGKYILSKFKKK